MKYKASPESFGYTQESFVDEYTGRKFDAHSPGGSFSSSY